MPTKSEIAKLTERWTPSMIDELEEAFKVAGHRQLKFPFAPIVVGNQSYQDLRGLKYPGMLLRMRAEYVDLSYFDGSPSGGLGRAELSNCRLIRFKIESNLSGSFISCDFTDAVLRRFRTTPDTKFADCCFRGADLSNCSCNGTQFINCDFTGARLLRAEFYNCVFDGCRFEDAAFGGGGLAVTKVRNLKESLRWTDYDTGSRHERLLPGATAYFDIKNMLHDETTFEWPSP